MVEKVLKVKKFNGDIYSPWIMASMIIEMAYQAIKNSYGKGAPRQIEFKILRRRLIDELSEQRHKIYTGDIVDLKFSPFDYNEMSWFVNSLESYLENNGIDKLRHYGNLLNDIKEQVTVYEKITELEE